MVESWPDTVSRQINGEVDEASAKKDSKQGCDIKVSEEMLRLLREINEKMAAEKAQDDRSAVPLENFTDSKFLPWFQVTHRGQDFIGGGTRSYRSTFQYRDDLQPVVDLIREAIGNFWVVPDDGRLRLRLQAKSLGPLGRDTAVSAIKAVALLNTKFHEVAGRGLRIYDFDPWNSKYVEYNFGKGDTMLIDNLPQFSSILRGQVGWESSFRDVLSKRRKLCFCPVGFPIEKSINDSRKDEDYVAPWDRLMGLAKLPKELLWDEERGEHCPYFTSPSVTGPESYGRLQNIENSTFQNLVTKHLYGGKFSEYYRGEPDPLSYDFHITFFETLVAGDESDSSRWRIGDFPEGSGLASLRRSTCSVLCLNDPSLTFFTIVLLLPEGKFFDWHPWELKYFPVAITTMLNAVINILGGVTRKWDQLDQYLTRLLFEDFMRPKQYSNLLFDDENFTRSQRYFWAIGCLEEFILSIGDNIDECARFYNGMVKPGLDNGSALVLGSIIQINPNLCSRSAGFFSSIDETEGISKGCRKIVPYPREIVEPAKCVQE
ncbi:hypothetical protein HYALB_00007527 [Hymenoscyphus albidus]|uniref:Uncharacterized protein n=1 Tax=Hymenoscyphus albidus TaxID=595503 RepID=A0A9N9M0G2_9HELO|nr:hypothetical protein HYALB_00007527 [Hymenoscyphus albidus]